MSQEIKTAPEQNPAFCPRCLIQNISSKITEESVLEDAQKSTFIPGVSTPQDEYKKRLEICRQCPSLLGGTTCSNSGSLVAFRAKILKAECPWPGSNKWNAD